MQKQTHLDPYSAQLPFLVDDCILMYFANCTKLMLILPTFYEVAVWI